MPLLLWGVLLLILNGCATSQNRVALVVGNQNYTTKALKNPLNDAKRVSQRLQSLGFDVVMAQDTSKEEFEEALKAFQSKINPQTTTFFYFSGHANTLHPNSNETFMLMVDSDKEVLVSIHKLYETLRKAKAKNNIIAIDGNPARLELARQMGADYTLNFRDIPSREAMVSAVREVTKGVGAHFAFSVTGVPKAAGEIFKLVRRGGGVCEVGSFVESGECSVRPHEDWCKKEMMLVGSWAYNSWEYPNAYHFLQRAARIGIPVEKLITHRFPLDRIVEAFETNLRQEGIKIVVENPNLRPSS